MLAHNNNSSAIPAVNEISDTTRTRDVLYMSGRLVHAPSRDPVVHSIRDSGAQPDFDSRPDDDAFLRALDKYDDVMVPSGDYRLDEMVEIPAGKSVRMQPGANVRRLSAHSADTTPVMFLKGNSSSLIGPGSITTQNNHPEGVVVLGHRDASSSVNYNALHWNFRDISLFGVQAAGNIGYWIPNAQIEVGTSVANYFGRIDNIRVKGADIGALFSEAANAHTVTGGLFWNLITAGYELRGAQENQFFGGFLHSSTDGVTGVRLLNKTAGPYSDSIYNSFIGFTIEPGGASSKGYEIEDGCLLNTLIVQNNAVGTVSVANLRNTIINSGAGTDATTRVAVQFNGSLANPTVPAGSVNVASITKNSTGNYTVAFTQPMSTTTYAAAVSHNLTGGWRISSVGTGSITIICTNYSGVAIDPTVVCLTITGRIGNL